MPEPEAAASAILFPPRYTQVGVRGKRQGSGWIDGVEATPTEQILAAVSDLPVELRTDSEGGEVEATHEALFARAASRGLLNVYATDLFTGEVYPLPTEVYFGGTSFVPHVRGSFALFMEPFHPFGGTWPMRSVGEIRCQFQAWQFRHLLDEDWSRVDELLRHMLDLDRVDSGTVLEWPVFGIVVDDAKAAEKAVRRVWAGREDHRRLGAMAETATSDKETLTSLEAAELLGISEPTLRRWRMNGDGPRWTKVGGQRVVYRRDVILRWLDDRTTR